MKTIQISILGLTLATLAFLTSCATVQGGNFRDLEQKALDLGNQGTISALGIGVDNSGRYDFALEKAKLNGRSAIAQQYQSKISGLQKQFSDQLAGTTSGGAAEMNDHFSTAVQNVFAKTLTGVRVMSVTQQLKEGTTLTVAVVMGVDAKAMNASLLDEVKTADPKLYERFRASQAYEELKKTTEGMDAK